MSLLRNSSPCFPHRFDRHFQRFDRGRILLNRRHRSLRLTSLPSPTSPYCGNAYRMTGSAAAMMLRFLSSCRPTPSKITTDMNRFTNRQSSVTWCASDELIIRVSAYLSPCQEVVYIRDLEIGEVEHAVLHVFIH